MRRTGIRVLLVFNVLVVFCTVLAYVSPGTHPLVNKFPGIFALLFPLLFFTHLIMVLLWISLGKWFALISVLCIAGGYRQIPEFIQFKFQSDTPHNEAIRVATYNVFSFHKMDSGRNPVSFFREIIEALDEPHILGFLEAGPVAQITTPGYPFQYDIPHSGSMILAKFPIVRNGVLETGDIPSLSGWADLVIAPDTVRVYLLHLASNQITAESEQLFAPVELHKRQTWSLAEQLLRRYSRAARLRAHQADIIRTHMDACRHPMIVMGDLNDVPLAYSTTAIRRGMQDTFRRRGRGIGTTYGGSVPGLRIDYIMASPEFQVLTHSVPRLEFSDHYPVITELLHGRPGSSVSDSISE